MNMSQSIQMGDRVFPIIIRRSRGRNLRLRINLDNQVVVSVPRSCTDQKALAFVHEQGDWLRERLTVVPKTYGICEWFREHPFLSAGGERFSVRIQPVVGSRASYAFSDDGAGVVLNLPETSQQAEPTLLKLVRRFAGDALICRINHHVQRLGLTVRRVTIRNQAGRWGSCSSNGTISLNWRLVLLLPELQDYVILHELAHLTEMNHSARFRHLLDDYDPNSRAHEARLKAIEGTVMRVGR